MGDQTFEVIFKATAQGSGAEEFAANTAKATAEVDRFKAAAATVETATGSMVSGLGHVEASAMATRRALFALSDVAHGEFGRGAFELFEGLEQAANPLSLLNGKTGILVALTAIVAAFKLFGEAGKEGGGDAEGAMKAVNAQLQEANAKAAALKQEFGEITAGIEASQKALEKLRHEADRHTDAATAASTAEIDDQEANNAISPATAAAQRAKVKKDAEVAKLRNQIDTNNAEVSAAQGAVGPEQDDFAEAKAARDKAAAKAAAAAEAARAMGADPDKDDAGLTKQRKLFATQAAVDYATTDGANDNGPAKKAVDAIDALTKAREILRKKTDELNDSEARLIKAQTAADEISGDKAKENADLETKAAAVEKDAGAQERIASSKEAQKAADEASAEQAKNDRANQSEYDRLEHKAEQERKSATLFDETEEGALTGAADKDAAAKAKDRQRRATARDKAYEKRHGRAPSHPTNPDTMGDDDDSDPGSNLEGKAYGQHARGDAKAAQQASKDAGTHIDNAGKASKDLADKVQKYATEHGQTMQEAVKSLEAAAKQGSETLKALQALQKQLDEQATQIANLRTSS